MSGGLGRELVLLEDLLLAPADDYAYVSYRDSLHAVVVGETYPTDEIEPAIEACREAGVQCRRLFWDSGRPVPLTEYHSSA